MECQLSTELKGVRMQAETNWFIRRVYGSDLWCAQWLEALCKADRHFIAHLSEQTPAYIHYLAIVRLAWRQMGTQLSISEQAKMLQQRTQRSLLQQLYQPYPKGLLNILPKFGHIPLSKNYYRRLLRLLRDDTARGFLAHANKIRSHHLRWVEEFPDDLLHLSVLHSTKKISDYQTLTSIVAAIRVLQKNSEHTAVLNSVKRLKSLSQLENWYQRYIQTLAFPPPPWQGNDWITPITTAKALKAASKQFRNCVFDYVRSALLGNKYFYCCQQGPAIVSLKRDPVVGWYIQEINGVRNQMPDSTIVESIKHAFTKADFSTGLGDSMEALWDGMEDEL